MTTGRDCWRLEETVDDWKRQYNIFLNKLVGSIHILFLQSQFHWFFRERGGYTEVSGIGPVMHFKLSTSSSMYLNCEKLFRYHFLLIQNSSTKYQGWISVNMFDILMRRISIDRQTSSESLWQPEEHHRVGFYPHHHCPLTMVWSSEVYIFCFLNFASLEALILSPIRNSFKHFPISPPNLRAASLFFPRQNKPIILVYVRIQHLQSWSWSLVFMLNFYCSVHVFFFFLLVHFRS